MINDILTTLGGLGLFLIGMEMMTDGLRAAAGHRMRAILNRAASNPWRGVVAGSVMTAMVQSSSATTVAVIGFVSAGLMSFSQSLGVIFGANLGTTSTGWLVVLVGFKLDLGLILLPAALLGALLRLFASGIWRDVGWALAGLSVLFFGIDALQLGMAAFSGLLSPSVFPADTLLGRLELVGLGILITVVTQSSSAGVASALAALSVGAISFPQAAALVIGMNVGTTFSAVLATLGGTVAARRVALAHVLYNVLTGILAFALLGVVGRLAGSVAGQQLGPELALVTFHTAFNLMGVLIFTGLTKPFSRLILRLLPERATLFGPPLDDRVLSDPATAVAAFSARLRNIAFTQFRVLNDQLSPTPAAPKDRTLDAIAAATEDLRGFVQRLHAPDRGPVAGQQIACMHALDHLDRLRRRIGQTDRLRTIRSVPDLHADAAALRAVLDRATDPEQDADRVESANTLRQRLRRHRDTYRTRIFSAARQDNLSGEGVRAQLDASRWLQRVGYHVWRIAYHLEHMSSGRVEPPQQGEPLGED